MLYGRCEAAYVFLRTNVKQFSVENLFFYCSYLLHILKFILFFTEAVTAYLLFAIIVLRPCKSGALKRKLILITRTYRVGYQLRQCFLKWMVHFCNLFIHSVKYLVR